MSAGKPAVVSLHSKMDTAEEALDYLMADRFASDSVSVLMRDVPEARLRAGTLGLLAGIRSITLPGTGQLIAGGPVTDTLVKPGSTAGDLESQLHLFGLTSDLAHRFVQRLSEGAVILLVHCENDNDRKRASAVLQGAGAEEIAPVWGNSHTCA